MNTPEDPIDALLREQNTYVDDNGFTTGVIKKLPRRRRIWFRPFIMMGAVFTGLLLALHWLPLNNLPPLAPSILFSMDPNVLLPWLTLLVVAISLIWGAVSALQWEE